MTLTPIRQGEPYSPAVEGGVRRTKAPSDGLLVRLPDQDIFLPLDDVMAAVSRLTPRAAPHRAALPEDGGDQ